MNKRPDSDPDLDEDDIPDASELLDFELIAKSQPDKGQGMWLWVVLILILAGGGWAGWMYLQNEPEEVVSADGVPMIEAPKFELKEKPTDPGGMDVPDRDKLVYDRMSGENDGVQPGVERLLPPPETPLEPPAAVAPAEGAPRAVVDMPPPAAPEAVPTVAVEAVTPEGAAAPVDMAAPAAPTAVSEPAVPSAPAPATEQTAAPAAPVAAKSSAPAGQGYLIQLSAVRTEQAAQDEWARMVKKNADVLGGLEPVIQRADLGAKGIYYRVRGGWLASRAEAKAICDELTRRNVGCIIAKP